MTDMSIVCAGCHQPYEADDGVLWGFCDACFEKLAADLKNRNIIENVFIVVEDK
jgi:hypothetical protein